MQKKDIRLGTNRGLPRLWLEGKWLAEYGFTRHTKFTVKTFTDKTLRFLIDPEGERKVSGKNSKTGDIPIIDINGALLEDFADADLTLTITPGEIVIRRRS
jgi:DNA (cytosine-5)-methyltransferase 1